VAQLCKQCHDHALVPAQLRKYIANFATPYPYNNVLFDILAAAIDWASVNKLALAEVSLIWAFLANAATE